ncbi:MAG: hypothetical protein LBD58_12945 [Treponema sp.]|jgi:hypothetical protein|nr:hypothetical protein [Treponema sp.]
MPDEVNLEEAGRHGGVLEPSDDRDGAVEEPDGLGARCAADFHALFGFSRESADGAGAGFFFEFVGGRIGHGAFFSEPDKAKVQPEKGGEQFSAGPVEVFPEQFGHSGGGGVIAGLIDPLFFNDGDRDGLSAQQAKMSFPDTVELEDRMFPACAAGEGEALAQDSRFLTFSRFPAAGSEPRRNLFFSAMVNPICSSRLTLDTVCLHG